MQNEELRRAQHELEAARDSYAELYDFAPLGYFSLNEQGQILRANIAGARLLGTDRPGLRGKRLYQFTVVEQRDALYRHLRDTFRTKPRQSREVEMLRGDGSRFFARLDSVAQTAEEGRPRQCLTLISDISAQRRAQALTQAASQLAERTSAAKTRFLAAASHDLRQPLQVLTSFTEVLGQRLEDGEALELVARQATALADMRQLLDALLDASRLESGAITPEIKPFAVGPLLRRIESAHRALAAKKGLALQLAPCGAIIESDPLLLRQILDNLVGNAIRYTRGGTVLLCCRRRGGKLRIEVWDTGIGIPEEQRTRIFEEFYQLDNPARARGKGHGLGLAIAARAARLLGSEIELRSRPGGSMFSVAAPLAGPQSAAEPDMAERTVAATPRTADTVLLVEDDIVVRYAMSTLLDTYGYRVLAAGSGAEALRLLEQETERTDILITDYRLPEGESGLQVIGGVRKALGRNLPAIILTGDTLAPGPAPGDCPILYKPVSADRLHEQIQRLLLS